MDGAKGIPDKNKKATPVGTGVANNAYELLNINLM